MVSLRALQCLGAMALVAGSVTVAEAARVDYSVAQRGNQFFFDRSLGHVGPDMSIFAQTMGIGYGQISRFMLTEPGQGAGTPITLGQLLRYGTSSGEQTWVIFDRLAFVPTATAYFQAPAGRLNFDSGSVGRSAPGTPLIFGGPPSIRGSGGPEGQGFAEPFFAPPFSATFNSPRNRHDLTPIAPNPFQTNPCLPSRCDQDRVSGLTGSG